MTLPTEFGACTLWVRYSDKPGFLRSGITETHEIVNYRSAKPSCRLHSASLETKYSNFLRE